MSESRNSSGWFSKIIFALIAIAVTAFLVWLAQPSYVRVHPSSRTNECINNLRLIDGAIQEWALRNNKGDSDLPTWEDIKPYLGRPDIPKCRLGGTYTLVSRTNAPTCSIPGHVLPPYTNAPTAGPKP
jgi:hypothetical protein